MRKKRMRLVARLSVCTRSGAKPARAEVVGAVTCPRDERRVELRLRDGAPRFVVQDLLLDRDLGRRGCLWARETRGGNGAERLHRVPSRVLRRDANGLTSKLLVERHEGGACLGREEPRALVVPYVAVLEIPLEHGPLAGLLEGTL